MNKSRKKRSPASSTDSCNIKDFLDMIAPSVIDFKVDHFLCGNTCRCVWALREYPTSTDEQAILRHLVDMDGVTIRIYTRQVTASAPTPYAKMAALESYLRGNYTYTLTPGDVPRAPILWSIFSRPSRATACILPPPWP